MTVVKSAVVLGVHSFTDPHFKTGIQYIAEGLAELGVDVEYVSVPSSPFDVFGSERRRRMGRVWNRMGLVPVVNSADKLCEFAFPAPFPAHGAIVKNETMLKAIRLPAAKHFSLSRFDVCIHDVGPTMAYLPLVQADRYVLRLNDGPHGLAGLPAVLVDRLESRLREGLYDHVWAVSEPLAAYARQLVPGTPVACIPNGVDADLFTGTVSRREGRKAVYMGSRTAWVDSPLLREVARLLPDWEFHCIGSGYERERGVDNLHFLPPIPHAQVPGVLAEYDVGLLPYRDDGIHMDWVHRPLKYYEYVAAGLGVAATDAGGVRQGLDAWTRFGSGPERFAEAVVSSKPMPAGEREIFVRDNGWSARIEEMVETLDGAG